METPDTLQKMHERYMLQARWTAENRRKLFRSANIHQASRVLEVGSGTGAILHEIVKTDIERVYGIDIDPKAVFFAHAKDPETRYVIGDGLQLPFLNETFDAAFCHFLLLWVRDPAHALREMRRVTKIGGAVLAFAEPDYGGRIDFPDILESIGRSQAEALEDQGANTRVGRTLRMLFVQARLENIHVGVLGGEWYGFPDEMTLQSEWDTLMTDLKARFSEEQLNKYRELDRDSWMQGTRVLFVPTFYALGWKKDVV